MGSRALCYIRSILELENNHDCCPPGVETGLGGTVVAPAERRLLGRAVLGRITEATRAHGRTKVCPSVATTKSGHSLFHFWKKKESNLAGVRLLLSVMLFRFFQLL